MHQLVVDQWSRGASPLHARDARSKLAALLAFLAVVSTTRPSAQIAFGAYGILLASAMFAARLPFGGVLRRAVLVLPFSLSFAAMTWWSGDSLRALALAEKSFLSVWAALLLIATTPLAQIARALEWLRFPLLLILVIQFLYRYLFVLSEEAQHMRRAALCRQGLRRSQRSRFQAAAGALGVLFARSWQRADGVYRAMLARGFSGHFPLLSPSRFRTADAAFLGFAAAAPLAIRLTL